MIKIVIILFLAIKSTFLFSQITLTIEGTVVDDTTTGISLGVNIPRSEPTIFTYRNNSITSLNDGGYMLQAGDERPSSTNNNLLGEIIIGNMFTWNGTSPTSITHAIFTGYNINAAIKYNYLNKTPLGILRKSNGMTNTAGGVAYNIIIDPKSAFVAKGMNNVNVYNNTFYSTKKTSETGRGIIDIYTNTDGGLNDPSTGTRVFNNIFYTKHQILNINVYEEACLSGFESDYNIFYCEDGEPLFMIAGVTKTFTEWQALGYDTHSVVINPDFINLTDFVPGKRLNYGIDLGPEWKAGLSTNAVWGTTDPATTNQNGNWQVGARIYDAITGHVIHGSVTYDNSASAALDSMWVYLYSNSIIVDSVLTNISGQYLFSNIKNGIYTISGRCTKPWNGVNATDALKIQLHFSELELLTSPVRILAADVNMSNDITAIDALNVKQRFAGLETTFARGDWTFAKPTGGNTFIVNNSDLIGDFHEQCVGDVNGSNILSSSGKLNANKVNLTQNGWIEVSPGQEFELPIKITTENKVNAISMIIPYPTEFLEVLDVHTPIGTPVFSALNDNIRIAWSEIQSLNLHKDDTLLILKLKATLKFTGNLTIDLAATDESELADETGNVIPLAELFTPTIKTLNTTGIENDNSILQQFAIFPNPASDVLNIESMTIQKTLLDIEITDMLGRVKKHESIGELTSGIRTFHISTADLDNGVYTLKYMLKNKNSKKVYIHKILISR